jgi:hypothetical protein
VVAVTDNGGDSEEICDSQVDVEAAVIVVAAAAVAVNGGDGCQVSDPTGSESTTLLFLTTYFFQWTQKCTGRIRIHNSGLRILGFETVRNICASGTQLESHNKSSILLVWMTFVLRTLLHNRRSRAPGGRADCATQR